MRSIKVSKKDRENIINCDTCKYQDDSNIFKCQDCSHLSCWEPLFDKDDVKQKQQELETELILMKKLVHDAIKDNAEGKVLKSQKLLRRIKSLSIHIEIINKDLVNYQRYKKWADYI